MASVSNTHGRSVNVYTVLTETSHLVSICSPPRRNEEWIITQNYTEGLRDEGSDELFAVCI